jgi:hypothetical protein
VKTCLRTIQRIFRKIRKDLPGAALLFPLSMRVDADSAPVVRTILSIDEKQQSMTFAGEIPKGALIRFMKANLIIYLMPHLRLPKMRFNRFHSSQN